MRLYVVGVPPLPTLSLQKLNCFHSLKNLNLSCQRLSNQEANILLSSLAPFASLQTVDFNWRRNDELTNLNLKLMLPNLNHLFLDFSSCDHLEKFAASDFIYTRPVSYTHLTLPTIYSV
eukprot:TRINITY_DN14533_c0_g1_i2.p1 TRINITY_DN14533_c0_g1~~TRINITY_DN14533_c0_g1_i2.p1  ORF type:complete len:119 (-),score=3.13 TRINITY_DN14533_c0_g1_i2:33-389(-)